MYVLRLWRHSYMYTAWTSAFNRNTRLCCVLRQAIIGLKAQMGRLRRLSFHIPRGSFCRPELLSGFLPCALWTKTRSAEQTVAIQTICRAQPHTTHKVISLAVPRQAASISANRRATTRAPLHASVDGSHLSDAAFAYSRSMTRSVRSHVHVHHRNHCSSTPARPTPTCDVMLEAISSSSTLLRPQPSPHPTSQWGVALTE